MGNPTRFPAGLSTYTVKQTLNSFPNVPSPAQASLLNEFIPYRAGDFTITQTNGTASTYPWNNGMIKLATTGTTAADSINLQLASQAVQFMPGNQVWFEGQFAYVQGQNDVNLYLGFADNVNFASAQNGVFFIKPAGGTAVHLNVVKQGTTTQFQNIADLQYPSGVFGNADGSYVGSLTTTGGATYTGVTISNPGSGYVAAPLILANGATGTGAGLYCQLGSGGLFAPYITAPGSGYTTNTNVIYHLTQLQLYYDGKGTLVVGLNGRNIISIGLGASSGSGAAFQQGTVVTAGGTYNTYNQQSKNYFVSGTQLTTGVAPVQPKVGDAINLLPLTNLFVEMQLSNTVASPRSLYVDSFQVGVEYN